MSMKKSTPLEDLARSYGVETSYWAIGGRRRQAHPEALIAVLKALGAPIEKPSDVPEALRHRETVAFTPPPGERRWGVFIPLYALHSNPSWGGGDFADLERLVDWTAALGGRLIGTLPLLASFLDHPFSPSPYTPVSRLFWNELFLAVEEIPELKVCNEARRLVASPDFQATLDRMRRSPLVDYRHNMAVKRQVLEMLARSFLRGRGPRRDRFERFLKSRPSLDDYACFRATCEKQTVVWHKWPKRLREGPWQRGDFDEAARRYHRYVQWLADEQIARVSRKARSKNLALYFDFPLGVHPDGYDTWRYRDLFVPGISLGAPPDPFFSGGQYWGTPPLHPHRIGTDRYLRDSLRHHLRYAGLLRIDHVMGLHRQFWIPDGFKPADGVYVRYPSEELYALICEESVRHRAVIVGEDLGTVPPEVRPTMRRHRLQRSYVLQFKMNPHGRGRPPPPPSDSLASLNTHDIPPFAAFWKGGNAGEALLRALRRLSRGAAATVLVNLEDLWLEKKSQNCPGTAYERPNWRRKARYRLEDFCQNRRLSDILSRIDRWRKKTVRKPAI